MKFSLNTISSFTTVGFAAASALLAANNAATPVSACSDRGGCVSVDNPNNYYIKGGVNYGFFLCSDDTYTINPFTKWTAPNRGLCNPTRIYADAYIHEDDEVAYMHCTSFDKVSSDDNWRIEFFLGDTKTTCSVIDIDVVPEGGRNRQLRGTA